MEQITGYEGLYEIHLNGPNGQPSVWSCRSNKYLNTNGKVYNYAMLQNNGNRKNIPVHRMIAEHFIHNPNDLPSVDHIDGNPRNNHIQNLRWSSIGDNNHNSSKTKGWVYHPKDKLYQARLYKNKVFKSLGYYKTLEEAHQAFLEGSKLYYPDILV